MEKNIGIDFGTTNTVIYSRDNKGNLKKIGGKCIRSAIYFYSKEEYCIGSDAFERGCDASHGKALVTDFKPRITEKFDITAEDGTEFRLKGEAIARMFLSKVLSDFIEPRFKKIFGTVEMTAADKTVITVPAKFDVERKSRIKKAALKAMFTNVGIAFEPTAAALAALEDDFSDDTIAVYDFGGGTFDVSVIEKDVNGHYISVDEDGDSNLGGNVITDAIVNKVFLPLLEQHGIRISLDPDDMEFDEDGEMTEDEYIYNLRTIRNHVESMKEFFSENEVEYSTPIQIYQNGVSTTYPINIDKRSFEAVIVPLVKSTVEITRRVIDRIKDSKKYVRKIIMAGGSSQLSLAERMLREEFEGDGISVILSDSVFDLIAKGALLLAEKQKLIRVEEKTATQFGIGVRTGVGIQKFELLIDAGETLPVTGNRRFRIDQNIIDIGSVDIPCYEKDVKNYPAALTEHDNGILHINTYHITIEKGACPAEIEVVFTIEVDGTLNLTVELFDGNGNSIQGYNTEINSDNDTE
jgi:molecular chaperone DnaK